MCGIVGAVRFTGGLPERGRLDAAVQSLLKRGPDSGGTWADEFVQLGHRRLAVVDLTESGQQPMLSGDGRFVTVFNGEIYNHLELRELLGSGLSWRGTSDTETLLEAYRRWGADCLSRLEGMFAFAIWDRQERVLFLARDRLGEKPLYYAQTPHGLSFASRPSALKILEGHGLGGLDPNALAAYVDLGYVPSPLSIWRGARKLPPAHYAEVRESGVRVVRYWDFRHIRPDQTMLKRPEAEIIDELDGYIERAVRARLLSDVPLGAFLSGGIDSSLVLAKMCQVSSSQPVAFTIGFNEASYDESETAAKIAERLGAKHVTERLSVESLLDLLPECVEAFDEPLADSSAFPTMAVARLARPHVTVALTGDAGDELFGGYHYYALAEQMARFGALPRRVRGKVASILDLMPSHKAKLFAETLRRDTDVKRFHFVRSMRKDFPSILNDSTTANASPSSWLFEAAAASFALDLCPSDVGMRLDTGLTLGDGFLQKVDVATMAFSLESRCVLTDHRLVEWAMRLPVSYKIRNGTTKYLLKELLSRQLPREIVFQPKKGFGMPVAAWLRTTLRNWAEQIINEDSLFEGTPIDRTRLRKLFALHAAGTRDAHPLLWSTLMLLCFIARHEKGLSLPPVVGVRRAA